MHRKQTGKYRVYGCAAITMAAWVRCGGWRFFAICNVAPWLLSHQSGPLAQGFDQGISATPTPIALIVLGTCLVAALASFISRYQLCKLLDTCINLRDPSRKLVAPIRPNGRRVFSKIERSC